MKNPAKIPKKINGIIIVESATVFDLATFRTTPADTPTWSESPLFSILSL
jgi:hypothetical protein